MSQTMRGELRAIIRDMQVQTVDICIEAIESLHHKQGLTLDDNTISACARLLRNLKDGDGHQPGEQQ